MFTVFSLVGKSREVEVIKHPLKRFESTLRKSLSIVIPTNLDRLNKHKINIEKYMKSKQWKELNIEEINASRTVQVRFLSSLMSL